MHPQDPTARPLLLDAPMVRRVWGGSRFTAAHGPIGEVWLVHEGNVIRQGPYAGSTLAQATTAMGGALLGQRLAALGERQFPLLIKLIDAAEWLSIQVHPDDEQAARLEGPGHRGKTEAWYVLESEPGAEIIAGLKPGVSAVQLETDIGNRGILGLVQRHRMREGDAVTLPAGAAHALGPGMLIYEIQQSSDITYRIYDWDRQADEGRALHIEQSRQSVKPSLHIAPVHVAEPPPGQLAETVRSAYFSLHLGRPGREPIGLDTRGELFHVITIIEGTARLKGEGWTLRLSAFETAVIPAAIGKHSIAGPGSTRFLLAQPARRGSEAPGADTEIRDTMFAT